MNDAETIRGHEQIQERTTELMRGFPIPSGVSLTLPPPSMEVINIEFEEYVPARSLTASVTASAKFANAVGLLQGGFLSAMFDDVIGPLGYLTACGPTTTLELTTHFLRPVFCGERLSLNAVMRKAGRSVLYIEAEAHNSGNKLVATAMSTLQVLPMPAG